MAIVDQCMEIIDFLIEPGLAGGTPAPLRLRACGRGAVLDPFLGLNPPALADLHKPKENRPFFVVNLGFVRAEIMAEPGIGFVTGHDQ
jgi:hypothetical protein